MGGGFSKIKNLLVIFGVLASKTKTVARFVFSMALFSPKTKVCVSNFENKQK